MDLRAPLRPNFTRAPAPPSSPGLEMGPAIGACLPGGRLPLGVLHEMLPEDGAEVQHGAVLAGFTATASDRRCAPAAGR